MELVLLNNRGVFISVSHGRCFTRLLHEICFLLYLLVVFFHVQHVNGGHFSGENKRQSSPALRHCDVQEPVKQPEKPIRVTILLRL